MQFNKSNLEPCGTHVKAEKETLRRIEKWLAGTETEKTMEYFWTAKIG